MMRWALACMLICAGSLATAASFDLLGRIERAMLYPFDARKAAPPAGLTEHLWQHDGEALIIWSLEPRAGQPVIVYFHGNAGNLGTRSARFEIWRDAGFGIVAMSARGAGGSSGAPSQTALTQDAAALLAQLQTWVPDADPDRVIVYGESLGTAVAIAALAKDTTRAAGLILEAPFTSVPDIAQASGQIPPSLIARIQDRWPSIERIAALPLPLLVVHGTQDRVVPVSHGQAIFAAAPTRDKDFMRVAGAGHADLWRRNVVDRILRFARDHSAR